MKRETSLSPRQSVRMWLAENDKTQDWLSSKLKIPSSRLSRVLAGYAPMTPALADDILSLTGVDLRAYAKAS